MEKEIKFKINCGEKTCASEPGNFCKFFGSIKFGLVPVCMLLPSKHNSYTELFQDHSEGSTSYGWTLRCEECLKQG